MVVQLTRLADGKRKITSIAEITGMEGDIIQSQELFKFVRTSTLDDGTIVGHFEATGVRPRFLEHLKAMGIEFPGSYFEPGKPRGI
jgi:pilus assembly protein CpaF